MLHRPSHDERGFTLVETLVVMMLLGIVSSMVTAAFISVSKTVRHDEDEARGLADVRKVVERLGRDIREARAIAAGADANHLVLWIDYNSDYRQQPDETVVWQLQPGGAPGHFDVERSTSGGATYRQATTLVSDIAFTYDMPAPDTRLVTTSMTYDAILERGTTQRTVTFASRLRNVS
jgi:prepilin-type N-terminal cleavage/methylation domain-containing protein